MRSVRSDDACRSVLLCVAALLRGSGRLLALHVTEVRSCPPPPPPGEPGGADRARMRRSCASPIGAPAFVRKDGEDEMWRYDAAQLQGVLLSLSAKMTALAVRHVETLPQGTSACRRC